MLYSKAGWNPPKHMKKHIFEVKTWHSCKETIFILWPKMLPFLKSDFLFSSPFLCNFEMHAKELHINHVFQCLDTKVKTNLTHHQPEPSHCFARLWKPPVSSVYGNSQVVLWWFSVGQCKITSDYNLRSSLVEQICFCGWICCGKFPGLLFSFFSM